MTTICVYGPFSKIEDLTLTKSQFAELREVTSYPEQGAQFAPTYRKGLWDGRKHLMNARTLSFPTGLLQMVRSTLQSFGITVAVEDHRVEPNVVGRSWELQGVSFEGVRSYQKDAIQQIIKHKQGIVKMATGAGKSEVCAGAIKYLGLQTLFVVPNKELMYQTQARFIERLNVSKKEVGVVGDGKWKPGTWVTVALVDTLSSRISTEECQGLLQTTQFLIADEVHHAGSETWYDVFMSCPAYYRIGASATPNDRSDGGNLRLEACMGPIITDIPNKFLIELGITAYADIIFDTIAEPTLPKKMTYPEAYKQGIVENEFLTNRIVQWTECLFNAKIPTLILIEHIKHGNLIDEALWTSKTFMPHQFISGQESTDTRQSALDDFAAGRLPVLIASTIADEGLDIKNIDGIILAGSRKSRIRTMQRIGRGLRGDKLILIEFANFCQKHLIKHSMIRLEDYKKEDCFGIHQSGPDQELVNRLWSTPNPYKKAKK